MAITIRIPENYAVRIISNIRNTGNSARMQDAAVRKLNIQPDGSMLVQTSADDQYGAVREVFAQNLGIPFAAILGFDSRITSENEKGVSPEGIGGTEIAPQDIAPTAGAGDIGDLSYSERIVPGQISEGPATPFAPAQILTPSFYRDQLAASQLEEGQDEGSSIAGLFDVAPDSVAAEAGVAPTLPAFTAAAAGDVTEVVDVPPVVPDPVTMPANLPPFWKERYNEYLGLPGGQQQAILDNQLQNYIDLNDWQISTGGSTGEEGGGGSGAAGADLTLQELEELATGGGAGGGFTFQPGAFTGAGNIPESMNLQGFAATGIQDMLNIFYSDPGQYIVEQDIIGTTGYDENGNPIEGIIGSQQSLSPAAQAALQAFSTQRGAESADLASRFGTSTPFGAIAGLGGTSADAVGLAELQARAGVSNPYAALGTGSGIGDIGTILRGGLSTQEQSDLAGLQARGGLTVEQQSALAGMQARGGLTAEEQLTLSGLQARGGLSAQERLAEQRLGILPSLFQATPQALGGLSRVLGGEEALRGALTPFFGGVPAQQQPFAPAPAMRQGQPTPVNLFSSGTAQQPTFGNLLSSQISQQPTPSFRPTLGDYQGAGMFEQGGLQAQAGMAGQELPKFLGEVSPQGTSTARGGLGAATTGRFTY